MSTTHLLYLIDEITFRKDAELAASKEYGLPMKDRTTIRQQPVSLHGQGAASTTATGATV